MLIGTQLKRARYMVKKAKPLVNENIEIILPFLRVFKRILCCCKKTIEEGLEIGEGLLFNHKHEEFHQHEHEEKIKCMRD